MVCVYLTWMDNMTENKPSAETTTLQRAVSVEFIKNSGGFAVKAIEGQKEPAKGWDPRLNTEARSAQTLSEIEWTTDNIGIHLHGDIVDVDIDGEDAEVYLIPALDALLPSCSHVWGRKSRPRTHRVYMLKSAEQFDPSKHPILGRMKRIKQVKVEVRGGPISRGEYSLLPSSVHPSGEAYEWSDIARARNTPSMTGPDELLKAIRMAGAVTLLAPHWTEGMRQELTMALSGFLHRAGAIASSLSPDMFSINKEDAIHFLEVLLRVSGDDKSDEYARKKAFEATWAKADRGVPVTGANTIGELTNDPDIVKQLYVLLTDSPDIAALDEFSARFAIWKGPATIIDRELIKKGAAKPFMNRQQFASSYGDKFVQVGEKRRLLPELLWSMPSATRVNGLTFEPSDGEIVETREGEKINQWSGFEVQPFSEKVTEKEVEPFLNYLKNVVCSDNVDHYNWVLPWIADVFKNPNEKCGTALVLVGTPGAGKSILGHSIIGPIIGMSHSAFTSSVDNITKNFNVAFANRIFVQCDEAMNSRQKAQAARLKALITDPIQLIEPKGFDAYFTNLLARFLFTSNDIEDAMYLGDGSDDRRYTVIEVSPNWKNKVEDYWEPLVEWLESPNILAKIHRYLIDLDYDKNVIRRPLRTEAKDVMQQHSWSPLDSWLASMLARGNPISEESHNKWYDAPMGKSKKIDRTGWPDYVNMTTLVRDFHYYCRSLPRAHTEKLNEVQMAMALNKRDLRDSDVAKKIVIQEFDEKKNAEVTKRVRIYPSPSREKIEYYLRKKYGFRALEKVLGDDVETEDEVVGESLDEGTTKF